jgi:hypothetical protein
VDHDVNLARELGEILLSEPQRGRVDVTLEDAHLTRNVVCEILSPFLAQPPEGGGAEDVLFEAGSGALVAGGPDQEIQAA